MELVSVIVPVYNAEKYIDRCIKSIVNQSFSNFELILIDDGSNDKSFDICKKWSKKDKRIKVYSQKNAGAGAARNYGLRIMKGEYVVFVDADDWIHSKYIELLYSSIKLGDYDIVQCALKPTIDMESKLEEAVSFDKKNVKEISKIQALNYRLYKVSVCAKIYKRDIFLNFLFREGAIYEDDASYYIFVYRANKIAILNETLYYYYMSNNSVMRNEKPLDLAFIDIYKERIEFFRKSGETEFLEGSIARFCLVLLLSYGGIIQDTDKKKYIWDLYVQGYNQIRNSKYILKRDKILFVFFRRCPNVCTILIKILRRK